MNDKTDAEPLGKRAARTHTKLLEATVDLLAQETTAHITVVDVARKAGVSPATFYAYFDSLDAAVLTLLEKLVPEARIAQTQLSALDGLIKAGNDLPGALIQLFMEFVRDNRPALAAATAAVIQGDEEFAVWLDKILQPTVDALTDYVMRIAATDRWEEVHTEIALEVRSALTTALMHKRRPGKNYATRWEAQIRRTRALVARLMAEHFNA